MLTKILSLYSPVNSPSALLLLVTILFSILVALWLPLLRLVNFGRGRVDVHVHVVIVTLILSCFVLLWTTSLLFLFILLECISFCGYILVGGKATLRTLLVGFLYAMLGSISTVCFALSVVILVGFSGSVSYTAIFVALRGIDGASSISHFFVLVAVALLLCVFLFKLAAAPFHLWVPGVYGNAPAVFAALLGGPIRFAVFVAFLRLLTECCFPVFDIVCCPVILLAALASLLFGFLGGIRQTMIRFLIGYSSVFHMGYILLAAAFLSTGGPFVVWVCLSYLFVYTLTFLGFFVSYGLVSRENNVIQPLVYLTDLSLLRDRSFFQMACMVIFLFSLLGLPPLAGFFVKVGVFQVPVAADQTFLAILLVLATICSAWYYLRAIYLGVFGGHFRAVSESVVKVMAARYLEWLVWCRFSLAPVGNLVLFWVFSLFVYRDFAAALLFFLMISWPLLLLCILASVPPLLRFRHSRGLSRLVAAMARVRFSLYVSLSVIILLLLLLPFPLFVFLIH